MDAMSHQPKTSTNLPCPPEAGRAQGVPEGSDDALSTLKKRHFRQDLPVAGIGQCARATLTKYPDLATRKNA